MKKKAWLQIIGILALIGIVVFISVFGFGKEQVGSYHGVKLGLDLAGGVSITYQAVKEDPGSEEMEDARYKLQKRAEDKSTESAVYLEGDNRINVDIPNVTDATKVLEEMGQVGSIYFINAMGDDGVKNLEYNPLTQKYDILTRSLEEIIAAGNLVLDGSDVAGAEPLMQKNGVKTEYYVGLKLKDSGSAKFEEATEKASHYYTGQVMDLRNIIAIVYDGTVVCSPMVPQKISGDSAVIEGQESFESAQNLATTIRIGALPLELTEIRSQVVGARLGAEAIETSLLAGLIGFIALIIFMIVLYRVPGIAASIALSIYIGLFVIAMNLFNVTLTLPGIAGIILSIGMAVDANVIIFARIQEEMASGKTVRSSIKLGFQKARSAIIDGNVTTLIAAVVLYLRGSGSVKGFAMTLGIGIVLSMITAMFITHFILSAFYGIGMKSEKLYGKLHLGRKVNFVKNGMRFASISIAVVVLGIVFMSVNLVNKGSMFNYSLDFIGGTSTEVTFENGLPDEVQKKMETLVSNTTGKTAEISIVEANSAVLIKTTNLEQSERAAILERLKQDYNVDEEQVKTENISSVVSGEMKNDAVWAAIIAIICMLIYIWIRFKNIKFAFSAIIALIHDVLIVVVVYILARNYITVGSTFIACILTILGYSINATIVVFDRIREDMKEKLKKDTVADVVNESIRKTFSRNMNTSLTTLFMVVFLAILGVDTIQEFAIPLIVGIVAGGFSSICLTGPIWYLMQKRSRKVTEHEPETAE